MARPVFALTLVVLSAGLCSCFRMFGAEQEPGQDASPTGCAAARPSPEGCGDGIVCGDEVCDDGVNDGDLGHCGVGCSAGPPAGLEFLEQPSDGWASEVISPSTSVLIADGEGRRVRGASLEVTLALANDATGGEGALSGQGPVAAVDGLATFETLTIDAPGVGYVLEASAPPLDAATSAHFIVQAPVAWPPAFGDWQLRKRIVVPSREPSASLADFPLLVHLAGDPDLRDGARDDGFDVRFGDAVGAPMSHETERYDGATGELLAWVRLPVLDTSTDTVFFIYYGNEAAAADPSDAAVWSNGYAGVWHLAETGSGAAGEYVDATGRGHDGTGGGGSASATPEPVVGAIGMGQSGDGVDDFIATAVSLDAPGPTSISLWAYLRDVTSSTRPGLVGQNNAVEIGFYWDDRINVWTADVAVTCPGKAVESLCTADFPLMDWFHLAVSWDGVEAVLYVDGVEQHRGGATVGSSPDGLNVLGRVFASTGGHLDGAVDEMRLASTGRPGAWFALEHANQSDPGSFCVVGSEERRP